MGKSAIRLISMIPMFTQYFPNGVAAYLTGGILIGSGVALLYLTTGRPGGISTFFSAAWSWLLKTPFFSQPSLRDTRQWRLLYALGLLLGGGLYALAVQAPEATHLPAWKLLLGGILIGYGARLGGGCTSGHGICGLASLSPGSLIMVITFLSTAIATAQFFHWIGL